MPEGRPHEVRTGAGEKVALLRNNVLNVFKPWRAMLNVMMTRTAV